MNSQKDLNQFAMTPRCVLPTGQSQQVPQVLTTSKFSLPTNQSLHVPQVTTSYVIHQEYKKHPVVLTCPYCMVTVKTNVKKTSSCCGVLCFLCCCGCLCRKRVHTCPNCSEYLGSYTH